MGRYLSCAIATSMVIEKKNDKLLEKEEINRLKESVGKIFNLDLYNIKEKGNLISLGIKKDMFDYRLFHKMLKLTYLSILPFLHIKCFFSFFF